MQPSRLVRQLAVLACIALAATACRRDEPARQQPAEVQSQTAMPANNPTTIRGCLKAGDAPGTFVVTTARTEGSAETATYHLLGDQTHLKDHIGREVEVNGVVRQNQELASRDRAQPSQPAGTAGSSEKPVVETRTELDLKQIEVGSVKRTGEKCD